MRRVGNSASADMAVVGGGPIGAATACALAPHMQERGGVVHWFDANDPLNGDFSGLSMSCPSAAGQVLAESFEPESLAMRLGQRTRAVFQQLGATGALPVHARPWVVCAPKGDAAADVAARETLEAAWRSGRLAGCTRLHGAALEGFAGLRHANIEFAICDEQALGVDPRALAIGLARRTASTPGVVPHFRSRVLSIKASEIHAEVAGEMLRVPVQGVALCVGVHTTALQVDGASLSDFIPPAQVTHLHVFDHRAAAHEPAVRCSVAGPATIARYEVFGPQRHGIVPHLPEAARAMEINPLLTDVPGLRRLLDTHFPSREEAEQHTTVAPKAIAALLEPLVEARYLPGHADSQTAINVSTIASYIKHGQPDGNPLLHRLNTALPILYVQPSNGRGVTQCIGLGEAAAEAMIAF